MTVLIPFYSSLRGTPEARGRVDSEKVPNIRFRRASVRCARVCRYDALIDAWVACRDGTPVTDAQRARVYDGAIHAAKTTKPVVAESGSHFMPNYSVRLLSNMANRIRRGLWPIRK